MTATSRTPASATAQPVDGVPARPVVSVPELVVGLLVLVVALLAWAALDLADSRVFSLGAAGALAAGGLLVVALAAGAARPWPRFVPDWPGAALAGGCAAVGAFFFYPGFDYGIADKDPGVYVSLGISIARTGSTYIHDTLAAKVPIHEYTPGARWPGVWVLHNGHHTVFPQFYHLWSALLACAYAVGKVPVLVNVGPTLAVLSVAALVLAVRRAVPGPMSLPAAGITGLLFATNFLEVWHARYPSSESSTQLFFVGMLLALVVALRSGWGPAAGVAGLLLGVDWLDRADTLLTVLVVTGCAAVLVVAGRWDRRCWWFAAGFAVTVPAVLWQAYDLALRYTLSENIPTLKVVAAAIIGVLVAAVALRALLRAPAERLREWLGTPRGQLVVGLLVCAAVFLLLAAGFVRPRLFGPTQVRYNGGPLVRTYDELNLRRLSWFLTLPGFAGMGLGVAVVALRRWGAALWALALPALLLLPVYAYKTHNSPRLMWWSRRYVPTVLPSFLALVAVAVAFALVWRWRGRRWLAVPGAAFALFLVVVFAHQSWPLRAHDEYAGSFTVSAKVAAAAGAGTGIFLWQFPPHCCEEPASAFGAVLWLQHGQYSALLPRQAAALPGYVARIARGFPHTPVFVVWDGTTPPPALRVQAVEHVVADLPMWQESVLTRPAAQGPPVVFDATVWRVTSTA